MEPPNPAAIDMRHTKLKASEAALLAGELVKPTWASRNEGIHERVSFEDTLWGFEMAGGAFYKTPLRVAYVRPGSRAEHACIRMGDTVLRINGQDTSDLTLQEAHKLVLEAGINLKIVVTSPDDKENAHYDYQDPLMDHSGPTAEELKEMERERVRKALERAARCRDLPWPWVRRKWVIYRESNCFMVPSKYENKHRDKFPELPAERLDYFFPAEKKNPVKNNKKKEETSKTVQENGISEKEEEVEEEYEEVEEEVEEEEEVVGAEEHPKIEENNIENDVSDRLEDKTSKNHSIEQDNSNQTTEIENDSIEQVKSNLSQEEFVASNLESEEVNLDKEVSKDLQRKDSDQGSVSNYELDSNNNHVAKQKDEQNTEESQDNDNHSDDKVINEIADIPIDLNENNTKSDDDILDSVLNDKTDSDLENER